MKKGKPANEQQWIAVQKEALDAFPQRRKLREKTAVRKRGGSSKEEDDSQEAKMRIAKVIKEEMRKIIADAETAAEGMEVCPTEEDDGNKGRRRSHRKKSQGNGRSGYQQWTVRFDHYWRRSTEAYCISPK